jgi:hypothetical protein
MRALTEPRGDELAVAAMIDAAERVADGIAVPASDTELAKDMLATDSDVPGNDQADRLAAAYGADQENTPTCNR